MFRYKNGLKGTIKHLSHWNSFIPLKDNKAWDLLTCYPNHQSTSYYLNNTGTGSITQLDLTGYLGISKINGEFIDFYEDKTSDFIYSVLIKNENEYWIIAFNKRSTSIEYDLNHLYTYSLFDSIYAIPQIQIGDNEYRISFDDSNDVVTLSEQRKNSFEIKISFNLFQKIFTGKSLNLVYESESFNQLLAQINTITPDKISTKDFDSMYYYHSRKGYYSKCFNDTYKLMDNTFVAPFIIGQVDSDDDGNDDLLIKLLGHRFINSKLLCYSPTKKKLLWERDYAPEINSNIIVTDLDGDKKEEIILPMYSPAYEASLGKQDEEGSTAETRIYILDNKGNTKQINGKKAVFSIPKHYLHPRITYLRESNSLLIGFFTNYDNHFKNLFNWDLSKNTVVQTNIQYYNALYLGFDNNRIVLVDNNNGRLCEQNFDLDFNLIFKQKGNIETQINYFNYNGITLFGEHYHMIDIGLLNNELDLVIEIDNFDPNSHILNYYDRFYYKSKDKEKYNLNLITLTKNNELSPYFYIILLMDIILLLAFIIIYQKISFPYLRPNYSYFIILSITKDIHIWNIIGRLKDIYKLPKRISREYEDAKSVLKEISFDHHLLISRKFLFMRQQIYEMSNINEYLIIQRISHDLKNKLILLRLQVDDFQNRLEEETDKQEIVDQLYMTIQELTNTTKTLTNLSKMNNYTMQAINIKKLINKTISLYINHPMLDNITFNPTDEPYYVNGDAKLLEMALCNLINNALDEINLNDKIDISVNYNERDRLVEIQIKNSLNHQIEKISQISQPGYSTKQNGTGLGTSIAKLILIKHDGDASFSVSFNKFICTITLPSISHKHVLKIQKMII